MLKADLILEKELQKLSKKSFLKGMSLEKYIQDVLNKINLQDDANCSLDSVEKERRAETLIYCLVYKLKSISDLNLYDKVCLFNYFEKYVPIVGRIIDLHTNLPLSSLRLKKPEVDNPILADYINDYFLNLINRNDFKQTIYSAVRNFWVYGISAIQIIDDFEQDADSLLKYNDLQSLKNVIKTDLQDLSLKKEIQQISDTYVVDPKSVSKAKIKKVINTLITPINLDYKGVIKLKLIDPVEIIDRKCNEDLGYYVYGLKVPDLDKNIETIKENVIKSGEYSVLQTANEKKEFVNKKVLEELELMGYTKAEINMYNISKDQSKIFKKSSIDNFTEGNMILSEGSKKVRMGVDNNPFNSDGMYVASFERLGNSDIDNSLLNRLIDDIVSLILATKRSRELILLAGKVTKLITSEQDSEAQLTTLKNDFISASENPEGGFVMTNRPVEVQDLEMSASQSFDLDPQIELSTKNITNGLGMSEGLVGGEESYGSGFMKIELLTNEYVAFRHIFANFVENEIFKPLAIKKGFIQEDQWGNVKAIYPKISFDRLSIARSSEDFQLLVDLAKDNKLPWSDILTSLGYNTEEVLNKLIKEKSSVFNSSMDNMLEEALGNLGENLAKNEEFLERVKKALNLKEFKIQKGDDDEF